MNTISAEEARKRKEEADKFVKMLQDAGNNNKEVPKQEPNYLNRDASMPIPEDAYSQKQQANIGLPTEKSTKPDMSKPPSAQEMSANQRFQAYSKAAEGLQTALKGNQGQTDSTASAANSGLSAGMTGASIAAMSGASGATIAGAGGAAAGAGVAIGLIQAAAARRQARNALENEKQLKLIDIEDKRSERIQSALQNMAFNMGQTLRNNQQIRL